jgi:hypothetical protein
MYARGLPRHRGYANLKGVKSMRSARNLALVLAIAVTTSGCATINESVSPGAGAGQLTASADLPRSDFLPEQSAVPSGTKYVVIQSAGGNILLGPIFGSMNIAANTKAMAEQYKNSLLSVDPLPAAFAALAKAGINASTGSTGLSVKPFVFAQHCYDERFRLSLVFHVDGPSTGWIGRYTYHLPTSFPA